MNSLGVVVLLAIASVGSGMKYDALRARFAFSNAQPGIKSFYSLPRTVSDAKAQGWISAERPKGPMPELTMYCYPGWTVCNLYAPSGFIAGVQVAIPVDGIDPALQPRRYFSKWTVPAANGKPPKYFWASTQYFVTEEFLKAGGPTAQNGSTLQAGGVWVNDLNGKLMKLPLHEDEIKPPFWKQVCLRKMGMHYFYNVSKEFDCSTFFMPWFLMMVKGELVGVGITTNGRVPPPPGRERNWLEDVPPKRTLITMPDAPDCFLDNHMKYGTLAHHIYYVDKPWEIKCEPGQPTAHGY